MISAQQLVEIPAEVVSKIELRKRERAESKNHANNMSYIAFHHLRLIANLYLS